MIKNKIIITSDHAGHKMKMDLADKLRREGYVVETRGSSNEDETLSYSEVGIEFANEYLHDPQRDEKQFIALCGSGIGISTSLNRFKQIRCARVTNSEEARLARLHNNANILSFGGRLISLDQAYEIFKQWEATEFEGGRHIFRVLKLDEVGQDVDDVAETKE
ncbi:Ribose 5-phosphate isomerase B [Metamycoplasma arthritidis]|uniref:Ribose-5-phosphate isomerase B n=1 Tax=Metamycoplasma arthritidis (strain 158L3-1) TaxID=243272 RepID=B3PN23_META1|nr:RpiB/LacA/LacB family sugar-phosphate isomerase [Metamycoplasma arthritidis]ACF07425.1 ribose-5-phosphate isomerase B [Metamycoplasma arthritidis 158L3-1]VEU78947.1 Ribose 5-phosphate isomerase B [Metamycoplasma arthritidis]